jgi:thiosulfate dehydrogenase
MRRGRAIFEHTRDSLPQYVTANLRCFSCHLDAGRRPAVSPLVGTYANYPRYLEREGRIATIEDRINLCLTRSLAGRPMPVDSRAMRDMASYLAYLSRRVPGGVPIRGAGLPPLTASDSADTTRGAAVFVASCARCHGATGAGQRVPGIPFDSLFAPALWGPSSFSIGAGIARIGRAAAFIKRGMPYDKPGTLTDQQSIDVAAYVLTRPRPDLVGKEHDWPAGKTPADVPYTTAGHTPRLIAPVLAVGRPGTAP